MLNFSVRIITFDSSKNIIGQRSGFFYKPTDYEVPIIITAGHGCPETGSFVETRIAKDQKPSCYNAGNFNIFYSENSIDIAYSKLPIDIIRKDLPDNVKIDYLAYSHEFMEPVKSEAYGFAVWNNYELVMSGSDLLLPQYSCYEVGMEYDYSDDWQHFFKTQGDLKKDEYYRAASGSPISDLEGKIYSLLLGRTDDGKYLRGLNIKKFQHLLSKCF